MRLIGAGTRDDIEYRVLDTFWTWPNVITVARFLLIPVFMWLVGSHSYGWATVTLAVLGATDWVDGYVARRLNQVSRIGMWLDPLADRLALVLVIATFVVHGLAPVWVVYAIVIPDVILLVNSLVLFRGNPELPVTVLGKIRTAVLLAGVPLVLLARVDWPGAEVVGGVATVVITAGCALHVVAAVGYFRAAQIKARQARSNPDSSQPGGSWSG